MRRVRFFRITLQLKQAGSRICTGSREAETLFNSLVRFQNMCIMNAAEIIFMEFKRYVVTFHITKCIAFEDNIFFFFACVTAY